MPRYSAFLFSLFVSASAYARDNCFPQPSSPIDELASVIRGTDRVVTTEQGLNWCSPFRVGEMRAVDLAWNQSPTGVEMRYNLERTTADTYTASVALNYIPDTTPGNQPSITSEQMLAETRRCLQQVSSLFETPSGQKLRIEILSAPQTQSNRFTEANRPPVVNINLGKTGGNSASHGQDMECVTRAHEILHLMGLVDEYDHIEAGNGVGTVNLTCKPVARSASIMSHQTTSAFDTYGGQGRKRERNCVCKDSAQSCQLAARRNNENLFYYMYGRFSPGQATRLGYTCRREEVSSGASVSVTPSSSIPAPSLTSTAGGFSARTYEFRESEGGLREVRINCQCSNPAGCNVTSSNFLDALYRVDTNSCPTDMNDYNGFFSVYSISDTSDEFGASRIRKSPYQDNLISFAVNKPFDGLKEYQLKRVIDGGCQGVSDSYTRCSSYASRVWNGTLQDNTCSERPTNCYEEE